jgi:hypothetical protein
LANLRIAKRLEWAKLIVGVGGGVRKAQLNPFGHQIVVVVGIAALAVHLFGARVLANHLQMDGPDFEGARLGFDDTSARFPQPLPR